MRGVTKMIVLGGALAATAACQKNQSDQNIAIDNITANADVETLPPDESSETPSNELSTATTIPTSTTSTHRPTRTEEPRDETLLFARRLLAGAAHPAPRDRLEHDAERVDLKAKTLEDGSDYLAHQSQGRGPGAASSTAARC